MRLYYVSEAPVGQRWQGTQADAKQAGRAFASEFTQREVPVDKPNLLKFLNAEELIVLQLRPQDVTVASTSRLDEPRDDLEEAELRAVAAAQSNLLHYDYRSPFSARTILADIDASSIAKAVSQFHGSALRKVVAAVSDRLSQLAEGIDHG